MDIAPKYPPTEYYAFGHLCDNNAGDHSTVEWHSTDLRKKTPHSPLQIISYKWRNWFVLLLLLLLLSTQTLSICVDHKLLVSHGLLCRPTHVDSRGWSVRSFCDGEVHPYPTTIQFHSIGSFLCLTVNKHINYLLSPKKHSKMSFDMSIGQLMFSYLFSVIFVLKVNESEAPGSP